MPAKPYDDCMVSLQRPHGNGALGMVYSLEGKCVLSILFEYAL